ncbi:sensor histidine kinase [Dictyobacter formicarum]|uniref:histidine kinase n=1 Tax=Dictyobacter formicarum TaxID=2778368 RepID=A0ABQ3VLL8_9CHLR|nr:ATP-binding protein [Dictyobacter formicarum]GHO86253.1 hypothetical protein KSZ_42590 [Dictyobacter formicarum]
MIEEKNQPTIDLLTNLSHELRTPLTAIKGYTSTLVRHEQRLGKRERLEFLQAIQQASEQLEMLINQIIEVQQLEAEPIILEQRQVDLCQLINELIADAQHAAQHSPRYQQQRHPADARPCFQFELTGCVEGQEAYNRSIYADRERIREALKNLLENALLYSPQGGTIEVGVCTMSMDPLHPVLPPVDGQEQIHQQDITAPHSQHMVEIWIRDHGIGIEPQHLKEIFNVFHRIDTRLTREVRGLGLGLTISKRIIELHNGTIWVESEPGKGSVFHVLLPAA